jgi:uncharacterized protein YlaI
LKNKLRICSECKSLLKSSAEFSKLCIRSYEQQLLIPVEPDKIRETKRTRRSYRLDNLDESETSQLDCSQDQNSDVDDELLSISTLQQQLQKKDKENLIKASPKEPTVVKEDCIVELDSTKKKFLCNECGSSFSTSQRLQIHSFTHSGIKNWKCNECEKVFATKFRLKSHTRKGK